MQKVVFTYEMETKESDNDEIVEDLIEALENLINENYQCRECLRLEVMHFIEIKEVND